IENGTSQRKRSILPSMLAPRSHTPRLCTSLTAAGSVQSQLSRSALSLGLLAQVAGSSGLKVASVVRRKSAQSLVATAVKNLASVSVSSAPNLSRARRTSGGSFAQTRASFSFERDCDSVGVADV